MAATYTANTILFDAAGDGAGDTAHRNIRTLIVAPAAAAGEFTFKDGAGTVIFRVTGAVNTSVAIPFGGAYGWRVQGLEMDAAPAGGKAYALLA